MNKTMNTLLEELVDTYIGPDADRSLVEAKFSNYGVTLIYKDTEVKTILFSQMEDYDEPREA